MKQEPPMPSDAQSTAGTTTRRGLLKSTAGVAATATAVTALSGGAAAHFPAKLDIDLQPHNAENFIDLDEHQSVSVAVFTTEFLDGDGKRVTFDPTQRPIRYRFGSQSAVTAGKGAEPTNDEVTEINTGHGDTKEALVLDFPVDEMQLDGTEETLWLYWDRDYTSEHGLRGFDSVNVYGTGSTSRHRNRRPDQSTQKLLKQLRRLLLRSHGQ